jgi:hypothetical protein
MVVPVDHDPLAVIEFGLRDTDGIAVSLIPTPVGDVPPDLRPVATDRRVLVALPGRRWVLANVGRSDHDTVVVHPLQYRS